MDLEKIKIQKIKTLQENFKNFCKIFFKNPKLP